MSKYKPIQQIIDFSGRTPENFFNFILERYTFALEKEVKKLKLENQFYDETHHKNEIMQKLGHQHMEAESIRKETRRRAIDLFFGEIAESNLTKAAKDKAEKLHVEMLEELEEPKKEAPIKDIKGDDNTEG